jgi:hypothetical protein
MTHVLFVLCLPARSLSAASLEGDLKSIRVEGGQDVDMCVVEKPLHSAVALVTCHKILQQSIMCSNSSMLMLLSVSCVAAVPYD